MSKFSPSIGKRMSSPERSFKFFLAFILLFFFAAPSQAQQIHQLHNPDVIVGELIKVIPSLKDYKTPDGFHAPITRIRDRVVGLNEDNENVQRVQYSKVAVPDPVVQTTSGGGAAGSSNLQSPNPTPNTFAGGVVTQNFAGLPYTNVSPADPNMCAGPTAVIQTINNSSSSYFKIWDLNGNVLLNQTLIVNLVASPGYTGSGDPVAVYDQMADRFLLTEFGHAGAGSGINTLIACISQTGNPLGAWNIYKFTDNTFFPDYPKWSAWPNAYYASTNDFNTAGTAYLGSSVYAFNRAKMLVGDPTAEAQRFRLTFNSFPVNVSGVTPPAATTPGMFMYYSDDDFTADPNDKDSIGIVTFLPNFAVPASTVLTTGFNLMTAPFKSNFCGGTRNCVPSAGPQGYDGLADRIMNRVVYRNFGTYEAIVLNYTVDANVGLGSPRSGLRWYELRRATPATPWSIYQQSTYSPCGTDWRWMGSINMNSKGQIALGYDLSSTTKYASMYFTGRNATDPLNTMTAAETLIQAGTAYGTFGNRWGDYNEVTPDVVNDSLFWMTSMWGSAASSWATRVAQFKLGNCNLEASTFNLTQAAASVPEGQNIVYTNTVNNTGCVAIVNYLLTDTLPTNVTFISATNGGTYNAGNRVVSWPVNLGIGASGTYQFTVVINAGAYFTPVTLLNETVPGPGLPAGWTTSVGVGPNNWVVSSAQSHSPPSSFFGVDNATAITDFRVATTAAIPMGAQPTKMTFWHNYNTESGWDGGVVEISTNGGGTWVDLGPRMTVNGYNNSVGGTNPIAGRPAFSGNSNGWIQTSVDLLPYVNQNAMFRFRMTSDDNTAAVGWYVDDINISATAQVNMRTTLIGAACAAQFKDTVTIILPPSGCQAQTVTSQPANTTVCVNSPASFSVTTIGTTPITYQWQESTNGGGTWNNLANAGIYSGVFTSTLNISSAALSMNGYQYRVVVNGCAAPVNSNAAILTVVTSSGGGTVTPAASTVCGSSNSGTLTLSGQTGSVIRWEFSINGGISWSPIANTTTTYTFNNITQTTQYRAVVQAGTCASANSSVATVTFNAGGLPMFIVADPGNPSGPTVCAGDPERLTVMEGASTNGTLYTQAGAASNGAPSQNFETAFDAFDCQGADDFTVPANTSWTINQVNVTGTLSTTGPPASFNVIFYNNAAALPGSVVQAFNNVATFTGAAGSYNITLPAGLPLGTGTYWVSVQVNMNFTPNGQWFWSNFGGANVGNAAAWQNPGGGFAVGCTSWSNSCAVGGSNRNHIFAIVGSSVTAPAVVTGGTFTWTPATGLSSTTTNPVAASPAVTTTYTVQHNNGAGCIRTAQITITVNQRPVVTSQPSNVTLCGGSIATFSVTGTGTGLTYQWQESTNGGVTYNNLTNGPPYSGVTTSTLTINPATVAMTGNRYRAVLSGACPPGLGNPNISSGAILTVIAQPGVTISPVGPICGGVAGISGLALTASGANTYTWTPIAGLYTNPAATVAYVAGANAAVVYAAPTANTTYTVTGTNTTTGCSNTATILVNYTPPPPIVTPNPVSMCLNDPAVRLISASAVPGTCSVNSGAINIAIPDANPTNTQNFTVTSTQAVNCIPANATITGIAVTLSIPAHTYVADLSFNLKSPGGTVINLFRNLGGTGGTNTTYPNTGIVNLTLSSASNVSLATANTPAVGTLTGTYKADIRNAASTPFYTLSDPPGYPSTATSWTPMFDNTAGAANGVWTLALTDDGNGDIGSLTNWSIKFDYVVGVQSSQATWSPATFLWLDQATLIPYVAGTQHDTVFTRPTPAGVYTYNVTVNSIAPPSSATVTTPMAGGNGNNMVFFNLQNTTGTNYTLKSVSTNSFSSGTVPTVNLWMKTTAPIAGNPGSISTGNGWNIVGTASNVAVTANTLNQVIANMNVSIPAGANYGVGLEFIGAIVPAYTNGTGAIQTYSNNGINIITDGNVGWGGPVAPGPPANNPRNFNGAMTLTAPASGVCTSPARVVTVTVNNPIVITSQPVNATVCTDKVATFSVTVTGTSPNYQWQESTNGGTTFTNITNGGVYSGATTSTLTITNPPVSMSGNLYRVVIAGAAPCGNVTSLNRILTVNPLPTVLIVASPYQNLYPGLTTTINATSSPAAATYTWFRNGAVVAGATTGSYVVDIDHLGTYRVRVIDVNGCVNTSNAITIGDSLSGRVFIYPNPTGGIFQVRYNPIRNAVTPFGLNIRDAIGKLVLSQQYTLGVPYAPMFVNLSNYSTGVYWVEVVDIDGQRLAMGRVEIVK